MMETLRAMQIKARKEKNNVEAALLTTLIAEAAMKGKNDGNRESTEAEVTATIKKFLSNVNETIEALKHTKDLRYGVALHEKEILEAMLPQQMDETKIRVCVQQLIDLQPADQRTPKQMGVIMGKMKALYDGQYDGTATSKIVKELLQS